MAGQKVNKPSRCKQQQTPRCTADAAYHWNVENHFKSLDKAYVKRNPIATWSTDLKMIRCFEHSANIANPTNQKSDIVNPTNQKSDIAIQTNQKSDKANPTNQNGVLSLFSLWSSTIVNFFSLEKRLNARASHKL